MNKKVTPEEQLRRINIIASATSITIIVLLVIYMIIRIIVK